MQQGFDGFPFPTRHHSKERNMLFNTVTVKIQRINKDFPLPVYATDGSACVDLMANIDKPLEMHQDRPYKILTGIALSLPQLYGAFVMPRSGLALKHGVTVVNTPGTIDSDFRGEISVILINHRIVPFTIEPGMRIAQLTVMPVPRILWDEVDELDETARGKDG